MSKVDMHDKEALLDCINHACRLLVERFGQRMATVPLDRCAALWLYQNRFMTRLGSYDFEVIRDLGVETLATIALAIPRMYLELFYAEQERLCAGKPGNHPRAIALSLTGVAMGSLNSFCELLEGAGRDAPSSGKPGA